MRENNVLLSQMQIPMDTFYIFQPLGLLFFMSRDLKLISISHKTIEELTKMIPRLDILPLFVHAVSEILLDS